MSRLNDELSYSNLNGNERYKLRHPDRVKAQAKKHRDNNKEKRKEYMRKYKEENPEKFKHNARKAALKIKYGITVDDYNYLLGIQMGVCAICKRPPTGKRFCVDHNHSNGKVRGLLCSSCNKALGLLQDNLDVLQSAVYYIRESP